MAKPPPVHSLSLSEIIEPLGFQTSMPNSTWEDVHGAQVLTLDTREGKGAWLIQTDSVIRELPLDLSDLSLYEGGLFVLVVKGEMAVGEQSYGERTLVCVDVRKMFDAGDWSNIKAFAGAELLFAHPGPKGQEDDSGTLRVNLTPFLGPLRLKRALLRRRGGSGQLDWIVDPPRAHGMHQHVCRAPHTARLFPHIHGEGGEVNLVLGQEGLVIDGNGLEIVPGDLVIEGPLTRHELTVRRQVFWATALFGKNSYPE